MPPTAPLSAQSFGLTVACCVLGGLIVMPVFGLCIGAPGIAAKEQRIDELDRLEAEGQSKDEIRKERLAIRNEIGGVLFEFPVKAVEGPKFGAMAGVAFGLLFGMIWFGVRAMVSSNPEISNTVRGFALLGGILGAVVGAVLGALGGMIGMFLPLLVGMSVYGAFLGVTAACIVRTAPR